MSVHAHEHMAVMGTSVLRTVLLSRLRRFLLLYFPRFDLLASRFQFLDLFRRRRGDRRHLCFSFRGAHDYKSCQAVDKGRSVKVETVGGEHSDASSAQTRAAVAAFVCAC